MLILRWLYLNDTWNIVDTFKITFVMIYLCELLFDTDVEDGDLGIIVSLAMFFCWVRLISFFRAFP
jgi:hypothetical protein